MPLPITFESDQNRMPAAERLPDRDPTEFDLDAPDDPPAIDTPTDPLPATSDQLPVIPERTLTFDGVERVSATPPPDILRDAVPGYEIVSELGRGGMGVVYLARDRQLNRPVALKMILSGEHAGTNERDRFRREAEAVAALQHPNIVSIYDIGEAAGRPYLAFEYVGGGTLAAYLDGQPWPAKPAAALVESLARAVHYAHGRGVVHRDLKPANVLVQAAEGRPRPVDRKGFRPPNTDFRDFKITDFGLAKRVQPESSWSDDSERTAPLGHTRTGAVVGTPSYIAPEQAAGKNRTIGPPADVYALGAILYELLTGRPPFRGETPLDTVLQVMADDPVPPSKLRAKLPRDLETICLTCLAKEPRKRYATADALAEDLRRFQHGEAIAARPVGWRERAIKWMHRHPAATVLATTSAIAVASLLAVSLYFNVELRLAADREEGEAQAAREAQARAEREKIIAQGERVEANRQKAEADKARADAETKRREAERGVYALQLFKAAALGERDPQRALRLLDDRNRCPEELRDFTWRYLRGQVLVTEQVLGVQRSGPILPPAARVVHSPDGTLAAVASGRDPIVRVYDLKGKPPLVPAYVLFGHSLAAHAVCFSPDGKTIATGGGDNTVRLWELPPRRQGSPTSVRPYATLTGHTNTVLAVTFDSRGGRLASAGADGIVRLWDVPGGEPRKSPVAANVMRGHTGSVLAIVWPARGLYSAGSDGRVLEWKPEAGGAKFVELFKLKKQALALAASPDGEYLAAAGDAEADEDEPAIVLYRPLTDRKAGQLLGHTGFAVYDLAFTGDGKRLASAGRDGTIRLWDVGSLQERAVFRPEKEPRPQDGTVRAIRAVSFAPDGLSVLSGGQDGALRRWDFATQQEEVLELDARAPLAAAAISADGGTLAVAERAAPQVKIWRLGEATNKLAKEPSAILRGLDRPARTVAVNQDGSIVVASAGDAIFVWRTLEPNGVDRPAKYPKITAVSLAIRGTTLVYATEEFQLKSIDVQTGRAPLTFSQAMGRPSLVAFSPDGRKLITAGELMLQVWDAANGELLYANPFAHTRRITGIAVAIGSTAGTWDMATADDGGMVQVWEFSPKPAVEGVGEVQPGQALLARARLAPVALTDPVGTLAFTVDGRSLATGGSDRLIRLRDPETGQERAALGGHTDTVLLVAFRASDRTLITVGREGFARVWRAAK